jgi:hypothetical protein
MYCTASRTLILPCPAPSQIPDSACVADGKAGEGAATAASSAGVLSGISVPTMYAPSSVITPLSTIARVLISASLPGIRAGNGGVRSPPR